MTIDISSGFVGIPVYVPMIHGLLIYLSTYGLSINWLLKLSRDERKRCLMQLAIINSSFVLCVFLQRNHLFIWTVFAPKLFYLCAQTAFNILLFLWSNQIFSYWSTIFWMDSEEWKPYIYQNKVHEKPLDTFLYWLK